MHVIHRISCHAKWGLDVYLWELIWMASQDWDGACLGEELTDATVRSLSALVDSIWAVMIVWWMRQNVIRTVLCCVVYNSGARQCTGPDLLLAGPLFRKNVGGGLIIWIPFPPTAFTRHVIIDILLRTRAAMHTTIAAAAVWQFEASL